MLRRTSGLLVLLFAALVAPPAAAQSEAPVSRFLNVSLVPSVATNDLVGPDVENHLSFGLVAARSWRVNGLGVATGASWTDLDTRGVQLSGAFNFSGAGGAGAQLAGGANLTGGAFTGAQLAGGTNVGWGEMTGAQLAGGANVAWGRTWGAQLAGGFNVADVLAGAQLAVVNVGGDVDGAQVGVINVARRVKGLQLGVLNVAADVDGASVGLVSIVKNGQLHLEAWGSDVAYANVGVKLGSRSVYTLVAASTAPSTRDRVWSFGAGLGVHVPFARWFLDVDAAAHSIYRHRRSLGSQTLLSQLRVMGGLPLTGPLALIGGPTLNVQTDFSDTASTPLTRLPQWGTSPRARLWPGVFLGVRI